jgi:hypothetical protein
MKLIILSILFYMGIESLYSQKTITFNASDGLLVTADWYESKTDDPFILLFHQANYSRGEYKLTAPKLIKLGFNCLAVDLRSGNEINFVKNKTAENAKEKGLPTDYINALPDIKAAIDYAYLKSNKPVIVFGSSFSASLVLMEAKNNQKVKAVVSFSPVEYFNEDIMIRDTIEGLAKPIFSASSVNEYPYMKELLSKVKSENLILFKPSNGKGVHGSKALWDNNPNNNEYWLALMLFLSKL